MSDVVHRQPAIDRTGSAFPILFREPECASGSRADGRFRVQVVESDATIDVNVFVEPRAGDQTCPDNPWTPAIVELTSPIGDREIRGVRPVEDEDSPVTVIANTGRDVPATWTVIDVETDLNIHAEVHCEDLGVPIGTDLVRPGTYLSFDGLLAEAVEAIDTPPRAWFRSQNPNGTTVALQFYNSTVVGLIVLHRTGPGWGLEAARCADLPDDWQPDPEVPDLVTGDRQRDSHTPAQDDDLERARNIIASLPSVTAVGTGLAFVDARTRCPAMHMIQDALHAGGFAVRYAIDTIDEAIDVGDNQRIERQTQTIIGTDDGGALSMRTGEDGSIELELLPGTNPGSPDFSSIEPCLLDTPMTLNVQPPT